jgi:hypothetical protein
VWSDENAQYEQYKVYQYQTGKKDLPI